MPHARASQERPWAHEPHVPRDSFLPTYKVDDMLEEHQADHAKGSGS